MVEKADAEDNVHFEKKTLPALTSLTKFLRYFQIILLPGIFILALWGPGFRLRQGWRGFIPVNGTNPDDPPEFELVECGQLPNPDIPADFNKCRLKIHSELKVDSLRGHRGSSHLKYWWEMHFMQQYFVLLIDVFVFIASFWSILVLHNKIKVKLATRKKYMPIVLFVSAFAMVIVQGIQWFYLYCNKYTWATLAMFDKQIRVYIKNKHMLHDPSHEIVVRCYVIGYGAAGCLALMSMLDFLLDAIITYEITKIQSNIQQTKGGGKTRRQPPKSRRFDTLTSENAYAHILLPNPGVDIKTSDSPSSSTEKNN